MSRKERIKISLDIAKAFMLALLTTLFGIFAFVVTHIETIDTFQAITSFVGIVVIAIFFWFLMRYIKKKLDELEVLE